MSETRYITYTREPVRHPWPEHCFVQGGSTGVALRPDGTPYRTAFVEVFPAEPRTFLRGEGVSIQEAEDACWAIYQRVIACAHKEFDRAGYTNGGGLCKTCGMFWAEAFEPQPTNPCVPRPLIERVFADRDVDAAIGIVELMARVHELPTRAEAGEGR